MLVQTVTGYLFDEFGSQFVIEPCGDKWHVWNTDLPGCEFVTRASLYEIARYCLMLAEAILERSLGDDLIDIDDFMLARLPESKPVHQPLAAEYGLAVSEY